MKETFREDASTKPFTILKALQKKIENRDNAYQGKIMKPDICVETQKLCFLYQVFSFCAEL